MHTRPAMPFLLSLAALAIAAVLVSADVSFAADTRAPSAKITSPTKGEVIPAALVNYSIKGTSKDNRGGSGVDFVEVSTDGGTNWGRAKDASGGTSYSTWSYKWPLDFTGTYTIKARAKDKAGNMSSPTSVKVTVTR